MIRFFRRYRTWLLWSVTIVVAITMLPWGVDWTTPRAADDPVVGRAFGEEVSLRDLAGHLAGRARDAAAVEAAFWQETLARYAENQGLSPHPEFVERLARYMSGTQSGEAIPEAARAQARRQVAIGTIQQALVAPVSASDLECHELFQEEDAERKVRYVRLSAETLSFLAEEEPVSEADVAEAYARLKDLPAEGPEPGFRIEERVRFECALFPRATAAAAVTVGEEEIAAAYERDKETLYRRPDGTDGAGAFLTLAEARDAIEARLKTEKTDAVVRERLAEMRRFTSDALSFPEDIPAVARRFGLVHVPSVGPVSRRDLAAVERLGDLARAATAIFSAPPGPIQGAEVDDGAILFRVLERIPAGNVPFEEAAPAIRARLAANHAFDKVAALAEEIRAKADETSLEGAIQRQLDKWRTARVFSEPPLTVETTDFFKARDASVAGVGEAPDFRRAAFSLPRPLTEEDKKRGRREEGPRHAVALDPKGRQAFVLTVVAARPPDPRGFAARREDLRRLATARKQEFLYDAFVDWLRKEGAVAFTYAPAADR